MGKVLAVCISSKKGTPKHNVGSAMFIAGQGIENDAHITPASSNWHRQVSLISFQKIEDFRNRGAKVEDGAFGENLIVDGIDFRSLPIGTCLECSDVVLEITQIGKECHSRCAIFETMGDCIMPREGVFARVIKGGTISVGDEMKIGLNVSQSSLDVTSRIEKTTSGYRVWIITSSDKGYKGQREDLSGPIIQQIVVKSGYIVTGYSLLPDDQTTLENELKRICDQNLADLILTTGGTGFSLRDCMPEATAAVAHKLVHGISEAMRFASLAFTKKAMFSRGIAAIRGKTLIINLPGSPKAVRENLEFVISELNHGIDILTGKENDCGAE